MSVRPLLFAVPATAVFSLVAAAGLAWMSPASALDSGSDDLLELAQATPPAAPPPAAGGRNAATAPPPSIPRPSASTGSPAAPATAPTSRSGSTSSPSR